MPEYSSSSTHQKMAERRNAVTKAMNPLMTSFADCLLRQNPRCRKRESLGLCRFEKALARQQSHYEQQKKMFLHRTNQRQLEPTYILIRPSTAMAGDEKPEDTKTHSIPHYMQPIKTTNADIPQHTFSTKVDAFTGRPKKKQNVWDITAADKIPVFRPCSVNSNRLVAEELEIVLHARSEMMTPKRRPTQSAPSGAETTRTRHGSPGRDQTDRSREGSAFITELSTPASRCSSAKPHVRFIGENNSLHSIPEQCEMSLKGRKPKRFSKKRSKQTQSQIHQALAAASEAGRDTHARKVQHNMRRFGELTALYAAELYRMQRRASRLSEGGIEEASRHPITSC